LFRFTYRAEKEDKSDPEYSRRFLSNKINELLKFLDSHIGKKEGPSIAAKVAGYWRTFTDQKLTQTLNCLHQHLVNQKVTELRSLFPKNVLSDEEIESGTHFHPHHERSLLSAHLWRELHVIGLRSMRNFDGFNDVEEKTTTGQPLLVEKRGKKHVEVHLYRHVTQKHWARLRGVRSLARQEEGLAKRLCSKLNVGVDYASLRGAPTFMVENYEKYQEAVKDQLPIARAYVDHLLKAPGLPLQKLVFLRKKRVRNQCPSISHLLPCSTIELILQ
jgi:hypothetical protein